MKIETYKIDNRWVALAKVDGKSYSVKGVDTDTREHVVKVLEKSLSERGLK